MPTRRDQIRAKAIEILGDNRDGVRYSQLVTKIKEAFPTFPINTILGECTSLDEKMPTEVYKAGRGLYRLIVYREQPQAPEAAGSEATVEADEQDFYEPFVDYLVNELEECTKRLHWEAMCSEINGELQMSLVSRNQGVPI